MSDTLKETCKCGATIALTGDFLHLAIAAREWRDTHSCAQENNEDHPDDTIHPGPSPRNMSQDPPQ